MKKLILMIFLIMALGGAGFGIWSLTHPESEAFERQDTEASIAEQYLEDMRNRKAMVESESSQKAIERIIVKSSKIDTPQKILFADAEKNAYADFTDSNYYSRDGVTYTPDYARGYLQCVLEIPKESVQIRRGVYSGTVEDIAYDLSIWMVTAARPDYELGKTHYVIYGHNHTVQNLSFNRLRNVEAGDEFYLTDENGTYTYEVTGILKMTREDVSKKLVDNFNISSDYCYIVTCGRDDFRYYDLVVEGKLINFQET